MLSLYTGHDLLWCYLEYYIVVIGAELWHYGGGSPGYCSLACTLHKKTLFRIKKLYVFSIYLKIGSFKNLE